MASAVADRNLILGLLALQLDLVGREPLLAALHTWALDRDRPLGEILVERGALRADRRQLLEDLVRTHLEAHDNDPTRSLAAVHALGPVPTPLAELAQATQAAGPAESAV